jgi:hypothetical protein
MTITALFEDNVSQMTMSNRVAKKTITALCGDNVSQMTMSNRVAKKTITALCGDIVSQVTMSNRVANSPCVHEHDHQPRYCCAADTTTSGKIESHSNKQARNDCDGRRRGKQVDGTNAYRS